LSHFERFERKILLRSLGVIILGGVVVFIIRVVTQNTNSLVLVLAIAVWLILSFIASSRLRRRDETVPAYKKRIKYIEEE